MAMVVANRFAPCSNPGCDEARGVNAPPEQTSQVQALTVETATLDSVSAYEVSRTYTGKS